MGLPVSVFFDAFQSFFNLVDRILVRGKQAEGEVPVKVVGAGIGHMEAVGRHLLGGFFGQATHLIGQALPQIEQVLVVFDPFVPDVRRDPVVGRHHRRGAQDRGGSRRTDRLGFVRRMRRAFLDGCLFRRHNLLCFKAVNKGLTMRGNFPKDFVAPGKGGGTYQEKSKKPQKRLSKFESFLRSEQSRRRPSMGGSHPWPVGGPISLVAGV